MAESPHQYGDIPAAMPDTWPQRTASRSGVLAGGCADVLANPVLRGAAAVTLTADL